MFSEHQLGVLEEFFKEKPYGSYEEREGLAVKLDLQEYQVQVQPHPHPHPHPTPTPNPTPNPPPRNHPIRSLCLLSRIPIHALPGCTRGGGGRGRGGDRRAREAGDQARRT